MSEWFSSSNVTVKCKSEISSAEVLSKNTDTLVWFGFDVSIWKFFISKYSKFSTVFVVSSTASKFSILTSLRVLFENMVFSTFDEILAIKKSIYRISKMI